MFQLFLFDDKRLKQRPPQLHQRHVVVDGPRDHLVEFKAWVPLLAVFLVDDVATLIVAAPIFNQLVQLFVLVGFGQGVDHGAR